MHRCSIVIPARIASTRLPGKMLKSLGGKPVVQHVIERAQKVRNCQSVYVVTDSNEIVHLASSLGVTGLLTAPECRSGTERIVSVLNEIAGDWIFNVQGDEPFVDIHLIEEMIDCTRNTQADILTPVYRLKSLEEILNPNVVKVVRNVDDFALYFSRSPIPFVRDISKEEWLQKTTFWGHLGIYGYQRTVLETYSKTPISPLEQAESLEQLRFLSNNFHILTCEAQNRSVAIDTAEDLVLAEKILGES